MIASLQRGHIEFGPNVVCSREQADDKVELKAFIWFGPLRSKSHTRGSATDQRLCGAVLVSEPRPRRRRYRPNRLV